ncbi:DnaT-like ssDNA-binding domain-containing protein [Yokenella regensburgei]|uniref:DnaT-like ssDNA-binding domain-containing protein n=1 Tax=Yokenella regensburgei TaxID=158877 RepID=UPI0035B349F3
MSIDAMRWAKKVKTGKSSAKAVLTWLADMCGADLCAFPSIPALAEATELDKKTVQSSLQHLVSVGLIEDTGERRGRTRQIPVYRLVGVEESITDSEHTQKREHYQKRDRLNKPKNGSVNHKQPENGCLQNDQTIPFFPSNDPKNGIRNLPEEPILNPTHTACEDLVVKPVKTNPLPEYPGQPGTGPADESPFGKFSMHAAWVPSSDFRMRASYWGITIPDGLNLHAELNGFRDYWIAEGKVFHQSQWEQKLARHLQNAGARKPTPRGNNHAGLDPTSTANHAVQQMRAARELQQRGRGQSLGVLGNHGGNLLEPVAEQKRGGTVGPMDCTDWEFDQRPADERL